MKVDMDQSYHLTTTPNRYNKYLDVWVGAAVSGGTGTISSFTRVFIAVISAHTTSWSLVAKLVDPAAVATAEDACESGGICGS